MGTNYYAKIIPTKKRIEELKQLLDSNDFNTIMSEMYTTYGTHTEYSENLDSGVFHLGKSSGGYKFLWNCNSYVRYKYTPPTSMTFTKYLYHVYPLTREGLLSFINRKDIIIEDEYSTITSKEDFIKLAFASEGMCLKDTPDFKTLYPYYGPLIEPLKEEGYDLDTSKGYEFCNDGLRFSTTVEFS